MKVEWPPGSGNWADYTAEELAFVRGFIRQAENGEITVALARHQVSWFHTALASGARVASKPASVEAVEPVDQPSLLDPLPNPGAPSIGRFHADPKPTELRAAIESYPRSGSQRRRVLDVIAAAPDGRLDEEIAAVPGIADTAHRTRRNELVQDGWVEDSGRTRRTASGTDSIVWVLTEQGRQQYPLIPGSSGESLRG